MKIYSSYTYRESDKKSLVKKVKILSFINGILLLVSFAIVLFASIKKNSSISVEVSSVIGAVDVVTAFAMIGLSIYTYILIDKVTKQNMFVISYRFINILFQGIGVLMGLISFILWIERDKIDFNILLPGLAWRFFIVISSLPLLVFNKTN